MSSFSIETLEHAMEAAIGQANLALKAGEFPYGAVVIDPAGQIIAQVQDRVVRDNDPTRHAEIGAVRAGIRAIGPDLSGHALISNVEPCAMCATAAWWANLDVIAFGISQTDLFSIRKDSMEEPGLSVQQCLAPFTRTIQIREGICKQRATQLWT